MSFVPRVHEIYKHFKGDMYQIIAIAEHTETSEALVIYQAMYGEFKIYARPLEMFVGRVDKEKYPEVVQEFRFELQGPEAERQKRECITEEVRAAEVIAPKAESAGEQPVTDSGLTKAADTRKHDAAEESETAEELSLDPLLLEFLDSDSYVQKLNILAGLHHRITDDMITTMAIACDVDIEDGDVETRYESLRGCLVMLDKYECNRLR